MTNDIKKQWEEYNSDLSSQVQQLIQSNPKFELEINEKLSSLINYRPPSTTIELKVMKERGDELLADCRAKAQKDSSGDEEITPPTESIAKEVFIETLKKWA